MEVIRILFALGFLASGYYAMEIQPSILPRNLDVYCKICDGLSSVFDNFSYEDYDFWRTIDIQEKVRFFCSFCKKKTESTTLPSTTLPTTTSETSTPATTSSSSQTETPETSSLPVTTPPTTETTSPSSGTTTSPTETTSAPTETTSAPTETTPPPTETTSPIP